MDRSGDFWHRLGARVSNYEANDRPLIRKSLLKEMQAGLPAKPMVMDDLMDHQSWKMLDHR